MAASQIGKVIEHLRGALLQGGGAELSDGQLLECFVSCREGAAVEALVRRHGPMVWGLCCRILSNRHDAEDAFQATFLVLLRKAAAIKPREMVGNWLYGVAQQTARKARATRAKRHLREKHVSDMPEPAMTEEDFLSDVQPLLDEELSRLPEKYRAVIVLCELEGKTGKEAARQLRVPEGTVASRLARGRSLLAKRLAGHGLPISAGGLAVILSQGAASACIPAALLASTIQAVRTLASGHTAAGAVMATSVVALAKGVVQTMFISKLRKMTLMLFALGLVLGTGGVGIGLLHVSAIPAPPGAARKEGLNAVPVAAADQSRIDQADNSASGAADAGELAAAGADPVQELARILTFPQGLRNPNFQDYFGNNLRKTSALLKTPAQLARGLTLPQWERVRELPQKLSKIADETRAGIAIRLGEGLRKAVRTGDRLQMVAAATLIAEIGPSVHLLIADQVEFPSNLTPLVVQLTEKDDPEVRRHGLRALGVISPNPKDACGVLAKFFDKRYSTHERRQAADSLLMLCQVAKSRIEEGRRKRWLEMTDFVELLKTGDVAIRTGVAGLGDDDAQVRRTCLEVNKEMARVLLDRIPVPETFPADWPFSLEDRREIEGSLKAYQSVQGEMLPFATTWRTQVRALTAVVGDADAPTRLLALQTWEMLASAHTKLRRWRIGLPAEARKKAVTSAEDALASLLRDGLDGIVANIRSSDAAIRLACLYVLEAMGEQGAAKAAELAGALGDPDPLVRWAAAARVLAKVAPREPGKVVHALARVLLDKNADVRREAALALAKYGPEAKDAIPDLCEAAEKGDAETQVRAIRALMAVGADAKRADASLVRIMASAQPQVRVAAAKALGGLRPRSAEVGDALHQALDDPVPEVRRAASEALLSR